MSELQGIVRFTFRDGAVEDFKRLSAQAMEIVRAKEPILATGDVEGELLGDLSPELAEKMKGAPVGLVTLYQALR